MNDTDRIAEQMAEEILRDPEFREEMRYLVRQAFRDTLATLHQPPPEPPPADDPLGGLSQEIRDQIQKRLDKK